MDRMPTPAQEEPPRKAAAPRKPRTFLSWLLLKTLKEDIAAPLSWIAKAIESTVFCILALALSGWLLPDNPFELYTEFPWLLLVPAILAMRYGTSIGIWSMTVLVASWFFLRDYGHLVPWLAVHENKYFPQAYFVGGLVLTMVCGQFYDIWYERYSKIIAANAYFNERLQAVTRNHFLLRLSHERLELDLLAKPMTLRETLVRLRDLIHMEAELNEVMPGADNFLKILAQSCQLQVAGVYICDAAGKFNTAPVAHLGTASGLILHDPLVNYCFESRSVSNVQNTSELLDQTNVSHYLVCAPIIASSGRLIGLLAVEKLPFFALNKDVLQLMSVLTGYYADGLDQQCPLALIQKHIPSCPNDFALDLIRLDRIRISAGIESSLVALVFDNDPETVDLFEMVVRMNRSIDLCWQFTTPYKHVLISLLPLSGNVAAKGYLGRIEHGLRSSSGKNFKSAHIRSYASLLGEPSPVDTLKKLLDNCRV